MITSLENLVWRLPKFMLLSSRSHAFREYKLIDITEVS